MNLVQQECKNAIEDIDKEKERTLEQIDVDKKLLKANFQLLKYHLIEALIKEFLSFFAKNKSSDEESEKEKDEVSE